MAKAQTDEFLSSMSRIIEEGIAVMSEADFRKMLEILHKQEGEIGKEPQTLHEKIGELIPEPVRKAAETRVYHENNVARAEELSNASFWGLLPGTGNKKRAIEGYLRVGIEGAEEWERILGGGYSDNGRKKMKDSAFDLIMQASKAKGSPGGGAVTYKEIVDILQRLARTGAAKKFEEGSHTEFANIIKEALVLWANEGGFAIEFK